MIVVLILHILKFVLSQLFFPLFLDLSLSNSFALSSVEAHYCTDRDTERVPLCVRVCECGCVAEDFIKQNTHLWHKSSEVDSRRGRRPCNLRVKMTSMHQQAQTHSKANL